MAEQLSMEPEKLVKPHDPLNTPQPIIESVIDMNQVSSPVNDLSETTGSLTTKIMDAKMNGFNYVETTPAVFNFYTKGVETAYFWYDGVKVYKYGTKEAIDRDEAKNIP